MQADGRPTKVCRSRSPLLVCVSLDDKDSTTGDNRSFTSRPTHSFSTVARLADAWLFQSLFARLQRLSLGVSGEDACTATMGPKDEEWAQKEDGNERWARSKGTKARSGHQWFTPIQIHSHERRPKCPCQTPSSGWSHPEHNNVH